MKGDEMAATIDTRRIVLSVRTRDGKVNISLTDKVTKLSGEGEAADYDTAKAIAQEDLEAKLIKSREPVRGDE